MINNVMIITPPPTAPTIAYITVFDEDSDGSTIRYIAVFDEESDGTFFIILGARSRRLLVARPVNDNEIKE